VIPIHLSFAMPRKVTRNLNRFRGPARGHIASGRAMSARRMSQRPIPFPPTYVANLIFTRRFRFYYSLRNNSGAQVFNINPPKLGGLIAWSNVVNTNVQQMFEQIQLRTITLWGSPPDDGSNCYVALTPNNAASGTLTGNDITISGTSMGTSRPAYVHELFSTSRRDFTQLAGSPQNCSTANNGSLFTLTFSGTNSDAANASHCNVIIDIVMECMVSNDQRNTNNLISAASVALPNVYYLALDNQGGGNLSSSSLLVPDQSLFTTS